MASSLPVRDRCGFLFYVPHQNVKLSLLGPAHSHQLLCKLLLWMPLVGSPLPSQTLPCSPLAPRDPCSAAWLFSLCRASPGVRMNPSLPSCKALPRVTFSMQPSLATLCEHTQTCTGATDKCVQTCICAHTCAHIHTHTELPTLACLTLRTKRWPSHLRSVFLMYFMCHLSPPPRF